MRGSPGGGDGNGSRDDNGGGEEDGYSLKLPREGDQECDAVFSPPQCLDKSAV